MSSYICTKNCFECKKANFRTDDKGYLFCIECIKYNDTVSLELAQKYAKQFDEKH